MQPAKMTLGPTVVGALALLALLLMVVGASGCGTTTIIHQTVLVGTTVSPSTSTATAMPTAAPEPPPGIWCLVKQGQMSLASDCEIFPSLPQLYTPPLGESGLAGTFVGPEIGNNGPNSITEHMTNPWAADVLCGTNGASGPGKVRIFMVAHTRSGDFYSWGDESCGEMAAPNYGHEFFRKATVTVTLSIYPLTGNLIAWQAQLVQL